MAKKSATKQTIAPVLRPLKAAKIRLTKSMRDTLHRFMMEQFRNRLDRADIDKTRAELVEKTNAILRAKYPEEDMPVLRKYKFAHAMSFVRFTVLETQRVFGVHFNYENILPGEVTLADIPAQYGDVYPCDIEFEGLANAWEKQINQRGVVIAAKEAEYHSFLFACRHLEDVEAVVPLTEDIRKSLNTTVS